MASVSAEELRAAIGPKALKELISFKGGQSIWIPKKFKAQHWLTELLGEKAASKLSASCGGESCTVPRGRSLKSTRLQKKIESLKARGHSVNEIAKITNLHANTVSKRLRDYEPPEA